MLRTAVSLVAVMTTTLIPSIGISKPGAQRESQDGSYLILDGHAYKILSWQLDKPFHVATGRLPEVTTETVEKDPNLSLTISLQAASNDLEYKNISAWWSEENSTTKKSSKHAFKSGFVIQASHGKKLSEAEFKEGWIKTWSSSSQPGKPTQITITLSAAWIKTTSIPK